MRITCPECGTVYRIDPAKIPARGVRARCARCEGLIPIAAPAADAPLPASGGSAPAAPVKEPAASSPAVPASAAPPAAPARPVFGASDPHGKARRLARALVSDIVVYHPERRERSLRDGTLRQEFREEIRKSWDEYVLQIGEEMARTTPYFREALNDVLAGGARVF